MEEKKLKLQIEEDDIAFLDDLKGYFGDSIEIYIVHNFTDIETFLTIGISLASLTLQAIDFISTRISKKEDTEEHAEGHKPRCIVDPSGRIELENYSSEEIKEIILATIQVIRNEK